MSDELPPSLGKAQIRRREAAEFAATQKRWAEESAESRKRPSIYRAKTEELGMAEIGVDTCTAGVVSN